MSVAMQYVFLVLALIAAIIFSRRYAMMKMRKAYQNIIDDLKKANALTHESAVELPYSRRQFIRFGLRDYRPKVLTQMIAMSIVVGTEDQRFFLNESALTEMEANAAQAEDSSQE